MDYETKPTSRAELRTIAKYVRQVFGCKSENEPFPVLQALDMLPDLFPNTSYEIVDDKDLPGNVFACCMPKSDEGFIIFIKRTVYDGAYINKSTAFLCFICHEICHVVLFFLGFTPISNCSVNDNNQIPPFKSVEWQAKALCGEVTIPYEATVGMTAKDISKKYLVTKASANYRVNQDKNKNNKKDKSLL